ncbi:extracellular solute-binding protein [Rhodospira trueperi]|uniref:extracellular solute-binding protein n=1 Tax=Rhodospira trueperi TaxID=69960 RepID=UPI001C40A12B|nr:extracellular solute-binding protein [Rhodospira trueperi]
MRVLAQDGQWPPALREHLARDHGLVLDVTVAATPDEVMDRVRRSTLDGAPASDRRHAPFDVVCLDLETVGDWTAGGLLSPLPADMPVAWKGVLAAHGALDARGRARFLPLSLGLDVLFEMGPDMPEPIAGPGGQSGGPPSWSVLLDPALKSRVTLDPDGAVWLALRLTDPDGRGLEAARRDKEAAQDLFRAVDGTLAPWRRQADSLWTDTATFFDGLAKARREGAGRAGLAWDVLIRHLARAWTETDPIHAVVPAEGSRAWLDGLGIPVNAPASETARRLLSVLAAPDMQATRSSITGALPAVPAAWPLLDASDARWTKQVLSDGGGLTRLWFPPPLTGPALEAFGDSRDRFEFA